MNSLFYWTSNSTKLLLWIALAIFLLTAPSKAHADSNSNDNELVSEEVRNDCPYLNKTPTQEELLLILKQHGKWLKEIEKLSFLQKIVRGVLQSELGKRLMENTKGLLTGIFDPARFDDEPTSDPTREIISEDSGAKEIMAVQANLCGANLSRMNLKGVILDEADLRKTDFFKANLSGASLKKVSFIDARVVNADLRSANISSADLSRSVFAYSDLRDVNLSNSKLVRASFYGAKLEEATLTAAQIQGAIFREADLRNSNMSNVLNRDFGFSSDETETPVIHFQGANLQFANLESSFLSGAIFDEADLRGASMQFSRLEEPSFKKTKLRDALLLGVELKQNKIFLSLGQKEFPSGLVSVREKFKTSGDREEERYLTFLIKRNERRESPLIEKAFSYILFEFTSDWGNEPWRPLFILFFSIFIFSTAYFFAFDTGKKQDNSAGLFQVWPPGRLKTDIYGQLEIASRAKIKRLVFEDDLPQALYALYFSILSAFHIGWRDFNVGNWIIRLQPREYVIRPRGWVRVVSGIQSLFSVYLLALWILVYFGRPFE